MTAITLRSFGIKSDVFLGNGANWMGCRKGMGSISLSTLWTVMRRVSGETRWRCDGSASRDSNVKLPMVNCRLWQVDSPARSENSALGG